MAPRKQKGRRKGGSKERSGPERTNSRRKVLKSMGTAGALPITLSAGQEGPLSFSTDAKSESLETVYESPEIEQLKSEFPNVDIDLERVQSALTDRNDEVTALRVSVPDGTLIYINTSGSSQVVLQLDEAARYKFEDWPRFADGWIQATEEEAIFTRTTTAFEQFLVSYRLGDTQMEDPTRTEVLLSPNERTYYVDKYDEDARETESLVATTTASSIARTDDSGSDSLTIQTQSYYGEGDVELAGDEKCELNGAAAGNIFFCLQQVATCALCAPSSVGGPQAAVACLLLVCFGTPTALEAVLPQLDNNCYDLGERAYNCYNEYTEYFTLPPIMPLSQVEN